MARPAVPFRCVGRCNVDVTDCAAQMTMPLRWRALTWSGATEPPRLNSCPFGGELQCCGRDTDPGQSDSLI